MLTPRHDPLPIRVRKVRTTDTTRKRTPPARAPLSSQIMEDPFDQVRAGVARTLQQAERQHIQWGEARRRKPVRHDECKKLLIELLSLLDNLEADLDDMESAVCAVEKARARFPHLSDGEVEARRAFVRSSKRATASIRDDVSTHTPTAKKGPKGRASSQEREGLLAGSPSLGKGAVAASAGGAAAATPPVAGLAPARDLDAEHAARIDAELGQHAAMQQVQLAQQDETLDALQVSVGRLKSLGQEMNDEISSQQRMLNELGGQLDNASNAMASLKDKMKTMMKSKDRGKFCAIIVLSCMLFALTMLVVYM